MTEYEFVHIRYPKEKKPVLLKAKAAAVLEGKAFGKWVMEFLETHLK